MEALTIQEFVNLREAMYSCRHTDLGKNSSAFQAKVFFKNEENFKKVEEKLRTLLTYEPVETTNEQPKNRYLINYETFECSNEEHYTQKRSKIVNMSDDELNNYVSKLYNCQVTFLG